MQNLLDDLKKLLTADERLVVDGKLMKNKIIELGLGLDKDLLSLLLSNSTIKKHFFEEVSGTLVFDKIKFMRFVSNKEFLPDSYTSFKNKIGLTSDDEFLTESKVVVLSFPYKDCYLEGGQTKNEVKHNEIFWNEILAPDEIDRLLAPKVISNFSKVDSKGQHKVTELSYNDNLIIKGNNLLALHTLEKRYSGEIKLIYIDPPYNTENDSFRYNDTFNHSSWLTFMKNRLEIAKKLLSPHGLFWISVSDIEAHYLKVLCDEVFSRENFVADIIWNSTKSVTNTAVISDAHTHNLLYSANIKLLKENRTSFRLAADESKFSNPDNDSRGKWVADPFQVGGERPNQLYSITNPKTGKVYKPNPGCSWKNEKKVFDELLKDNRIVFGVAGDAGPQRKRFWSEAKERGQVTTTLWKDLPTTTDGTKHLKDLFSEKVFENPKPEGLMERIIQLSTDEGDIVLDYHLGSGTTASTAHKMGRRYIGIEQMDYIEEVPVARLKKVIKGEQGGISESVSWKGGGEFIYCELFSVNEIFSSQIKKAKDSKELKGIYNKVFSDAFVDYKVNVDEFAKNYSEFEKLEITDQKKMLNAILDKNILYLPYSEIEDKDFSLSPEIKKLNSIFQSKK